MRQLKRRQVVIVRFARRAVDHLVENAHADQSVAEIEVEPRQPLGGLIGEQERRQKREELSGVAPVSITR